MWSLHDQNQSDPIRTLPRKQCGPGGVAGTHLHDGEHLQVTGILQPHRDVYHSGLVDIVGVLYVDDTNLFIMNDHVRIPCVLWAESQEALALWGCLIIDTGGNLKPAKLFYYLV